jgi:type II restriction enzyme
MLELIAMKNLETLNKGEWSEVYCILKTMADGQLTVPHQSAPLKVVGGVLEGHSSPIRYTLDQTGATFHSGATTHRATKDDLHALSQHVLHAIQTSQSTTFSIAQISAFSQTFDGIKFKSNSQTKGDAVFLADIEGTATEYGFSIKSFLGNNPTLINAKFHLFCAKHTIK